RPTAQRPAAWRPAARATAARFLPPAASRARSPAEEPRASRLSLGIQAAEVFQHQSALLGAEATQLAPVRYTVLPRRTTLRSAAWRQEGGGRGGGLAFAPAGVLPLLALQGTPRVQHPPEQPLLSLGHARVEGADLQRVGQLPCLTSHLVRASAGIAVAELAKFARDLTLLPRELTRRIPRALTRLTVRARKQAACLGVQRALPLRQLAHLLDHLAESRRTAGGVHPLPVPHEGGRGTRERLACIPHGARHLLLRAGRRRPFPRSARRCLGRAVHLFARFRHCTLRTLREVR